MLLFKCVSKRIRDFLKCFGVVIIAANLLAFSNLM